MTSRLLKKPIGFVALDRLRVNVQEHASAYRSSRASLMDLFEQPATEVSNLLNFYTSQKFLVRLSTKLDFICHLRAPI
jgi:hypothetical protein